VRGDSMTEAWPETKAAWRRFRHNVRACIAIWLAARLINVLAKMGADREVLLTFAVRNAIPLASDVPELSATLANQEKP